MSQEPNKEAKLIGILRTSQRIIYYVAAFALIVPVVMLFASAAMNVVRVLEIGVLETALTVLDRVLLIFIFVELLDTITIMIRERQIIAEPFLLIGLIAVVRRILLVTAELEQATGTEEFQDLLMELGVLTALVFVLTVAFYFIRRTGRSEGSQEESS